MFFPEQSSSSSSKKIILRCSDDEIFEVEEKVLSECRIIKHMVDDGCAEEVIPLPNVSGRIMSNIIEYCKKHMEVAEDENKIYCYDGCQELKDWDTEFVKEIKKNQRILFELIMAANYLDNQNLMDLLCKSVADMMRGKTPEEIREIFHIKNDFTPEEEEEVRRQNQWAFE